MSPMRSAPSFLSDKARLASKINHAATDESPKLCKRPRRCRLQRTLRLIGPVLSDTASPRCPVCPLGMRIVSQGGEDTVTDQIVCPTGRLWRNLARICAESTRLKSQPHRG